ncbi:MAG: alkaline phosphatase family protein [Polyangiaceae bacterium]|nr:alkaline phosphatase family protein [Polyangiaceae bacterium]
MPRCLVLGLDCAPPLLVFDRYRALLPNLTALMDRGFFGPLRSTAPPITVPAWVSMTTGRDPGELGLYGFRNRVPRSYAMKTATSRDVAAKRVWDLVGESGRRVAALFVPLTSPPTPLRGSMVSCFLSPGGNAPWTFPPALANELRERFGEYEPDVPDFRTDDLARVEADLFRTTAQHFDIAAHILEKDRPDFAMMVEIGTDRLHHAFWAQMDPDHPRHDPTGPFRDIGERYYAFIDQRIGELLAIAGAETDVLVVSDHGARPMLGGFAINEWLAREGDLVLRSSPSEPTTLEEAGIDWARTRAVGDGGYYARIFLNVEGRDPDGVVPESRYEEEREHLALRLSALTMPDGKKLAVRVDRPEAVYRRVRGRAPDLLVYFGDLDHRSVGTVGHGRVFLESNNRGPDACNHDWEGIVIGAGPSIARRGRVEGASIYDVLPTVLDCLGVARPADILGTSLITRSPRV